MTPTTTRTDGPQTPYERAVYQWAARYYPDIRETWHRYLRYYEAQYQRSKTRRLRHP